MNEINIRTEDLAENPAPQLPVALCVDVSGSMDGPPIQELNQGVELFYRSVQQHEQARRSVEVAVVSFAERSVVVQDFGPILAAAPARLQVGEDCGGTSLGSGVATCLDLLENRKKAYQQAGAEYYQAWLVVITDGCPTDTIHETVAPRVAALVNARKLSVFPIAVGNAVDLSALALISPKRPPLRLKGLAFAEFFEFLSRSVAQVSVSQPGETVRIDTSGMEQWAEI